ncbi:MAG: aldehyde dehydrogenase family protein [bacterium]
MKEEYHTPGLDIERILDNAIRAAETYRAYDQKKINQITKAVYRAGFENRYHLAKLAFKETKLGKWEDKVIKNTIATKFVYEDIKNAKTVGIINEIKNKGIIEIAEPVGPIFAMTPITNPTSTALFKILIAVKTRNPIIIRPHGSAKKCTTEACRILYEAAIKAGAPEYCIQWIKISTKEETLALMSHKKISLNLITGSLELVRAAYRSGNPTIGVGPGNVPVFISKTADIPFAVEQILISKTFDNGTICASEQAVVVEQDIADKVIDEFKKRKAFFLSAREIKLLEPVVFDCSKAVMKVEVIGQPAARIAEMAGFKIPGDTSVLIAPLEEVGPHCPLSMEILAPILAFYIAKDFNHALELCYQINQHGGLGHTASIFTNQKSEIAQFASVIKAGRILVNTPASYGALGGTYNKLKPSFVLACGTMGKNITADNISVRHLLNIHRIAIRKEKPFSSLKD